MKIHFLSHFESFMWEWKFEKKFFKKIIYNALMGCSLFSNSHFQMGVTIMGLQSTFGLVMQFLDNFWQEYHSVQSSGSGSCWADWEVPIIAILTLDFLECHVKRHEEPVKGPRGLTVACIRLWLEFDPSKRLRIILVVESQIGTFKP